jgi:hypothetical protein
MRIATFAVPNARSTPRGSNRCAWVMAVPEVKEAVGRAFSSS